MRVFINFIIFEIYLNSGIADTPKCFEQPGVMELYSCCDVPYTSPVYEKCKNEIIKKAINDTNLEMEIRRNELTFEMCTAECEFQVKSFLRGLNDIDFVAVQKDLEECFPHEVEYAQNYIKGIYDCLDFARNRAESFATEQNLICNYFPGLLRKCAFYTVIRNCSAERWLNSEKCEELKSWLQFCNKLKVN